MNVNGNITKYHDEGGTPVKDWYYEKYINGKKARLIRCVDEDAGDWEDTGIQFENQEEAEEYKHNLDEKDAPYYQYEMIQNEE